MGKFCRWATSICELIVNNPYHVDGQNCPSQLRKNKKKEVKTLALCKHNPYTSRQGLRCWRVELKLCQDLTVAADRRYFLNERRPPLLYHFLTYHKTNLTRCKYLAPSLPFVKLVFFIYYTCFFAL